MSRPTKKKTAARAPDLRVCARLLPTAIFNQLMWIVATTSGSASEAIGRQIIILLTVDTPMPERPALRIAELLLKFADPVVDMPREKFDAQWLAQRGVIYTEVALKIFAVIEKYSRAKARAERKAGAK
jgi:hypothetical protein